MFHIDSDPAEHTNLKESEPSKYLELKAQLDQSIGVEEQPPGGADDLLGGHYDTAPLSATNAACQAMQGTWKGFFGPFAAAPHPPGPPGPPPSPGPHPPAQANCTWLADTDYDIGGPGELGPPRDATSKEQCCAVCWADPGCAAAVFSGAKALGRCDRPPGANCCWLKSTSEVAKPRNDPGTVSCAPKR